MMEDNSIDNRMEAALKQDAAAMGKGSTDVPDSLRALIARTPVAATTTSIGAASVAEIAATKLALWSAGGLLVVAAGYFAISSDDKTPINPLPEPVLMPIAIDSPKPVVDTTYQRNTKALPAARSAVKSTAVYTQAQIDSMMRALPEPTGTVRESDSVRGTMRRR